MAPEVRAKMSEEQAWQLALCAGDDYELCITTAPDDAPELCAKISALGGRITRVGWVESEPGLRCLDGHARQLRLENGYQHFR